MAHTLSSGLMLLKFLPPCWGLTPFQEAGH
jgi:hypothetical protein